MKLEDQVCSLELAKQLKEVGVPQDSLFTYKDIGLGYQLTNEVCDSNATITTKKGERKVIDYSAFIASEIMEVLPACVIDNKGKNNEAWYWLGISKSYDGTYAVHYYDDEDVWPKCKSWVWGKTSVEALGKMVLFLVKKGQLKFKYAKKKR
jgi:hypothetical protein